MATPTNSEGQLPPATQLGRTRAGTAQIGEQTKTRGELIDNASSSVRNREQARNFLDKNRYVAKDDPISHEGLSFALLCLAHNATTRTLQEGARAVAILMMDASARSLGEQAMKYVEEKLEPIMRKTDEMTDALREATYDTIRAADAAADAIESATRNDGRQTIAQGSTYAAALKGTVPLAHPNTLARAKARSCQILVDKDPNSGTSSLTELTELELVAKANEAVEHMETQESGKEVRFVGAKKLTNGGIVFDMGTPEAANHIQHHKQDFLQRFSASAIVKERSVSVIVEYVPVSHSPDALAEYARIEHDSGLPEGTLAVTRWIKPIQRRSPGQKSAHLIARFSTTEAANKAIRDGLIIAGKRTWARRMRREPRRCLRCQRYNVRHMAAECDGMSTCGTCAKEHRTAECGETNPDRYKCVNCDATGHASWDRTCPKFLAASERIEKSDPESTYKYFPDENPWTWEQQHTEGEKLMGNVPVTGTRELEAPPLEVPRNTQHTIQRLETPDQGQAGEPETGQRRGRANPQIGHRDDGWQRTQPRNQSRPGTRPGSRQTTINEHFTTNTWGGRGAELQVDHNHRAGV
jgi:hypothetical protein